MHQVNPCGLVKFNDQISASSSNWHWSTSTHLNMALKLPAQKTAREQAAKDYDIQPLQLLTDGDAMASASEFEFDHLLRLRILYTQRVRPEKLAISDGFPTERLK